MGPLNLKQIVIFGGLFAFACILFLAPRGQDSTFWYSIAVAGLMITFWLFEVIPIYVTALFPFIFAIPLKVLTSDQLTAAYGHKYIYLFFGGFVLSLALEKWDVHRQIAERIIRIVGTSKSRIILGFLIATAFLSMWISNTATALMMLPMALAVISNIKRTKKSRFPKFLLLTIAYGSSVGGMATIVGSPPNILMAGMLNESYGIQIEFIDWLKIGMPVSLVILGVVFLLFYLMMGKERNEALEELEHEHKPWTRNQKRVIALFSLIVLLWGLREPLVSWLGIHYSDEGVAVMGAILMFILPSTDKGETLLEWKDTKKLPWGILLLFGGGMAMATMLETNGVVEQLSAVFEGYASSPLIVLLTILVTLSIFGTEVMSNMALVSVFVPVVAAFAAQTDYSIIQLCMPITLAASCAFMLPVGTPPNAIVFSSGELKINEMARVGFVLNVLAVIIVVAFGAMFL